LFLARRLQIHLLTYVRGEAGTGKADGGLYANCGYKVFSALQSNGHTGSLGVELLFHSASLNALQAVQQCILPFFFFSVIVITCYLSLVVYRIYVVVQIRTN